MNNVHLLSATRVLNYRKKETKQGHSANRAKWPKEGFDNIVNSNQIKSSVRLHNH